MNLTNEFNPIRIWAAEKGILQKGTIQSQFLKLLEEVGELSHGIQKKNDAEISDAIGDCVVVLTNLAALANMQIEDCINGAYQEIANRKGEIINGTFVKIPQNVSANCCGNCHTK
jgi:NTP pyrophosphatase (non-canonical NTP hydrolase)